MLPLLGWRAQEMVGLNYLGNGDKIRSSQAKHSNRMDIGTNTDPAPDNLKKCSSQETRRWFENAWSVDMDMDMTPEKILHPKSAEVDQTVIVGRRG